MNSRRRRRSADHRPRLGVAISLLCAAALASPARAEGPPPASSAARALAPAAVPAPGPAAAAAATTAAPRDPLVVEVWTFGPGDHPFTRFGHNAIRILDRQAMTDESYNFGTFEFEAASLIGDFLQGRLRYWLSFARTRALAHSYQRENRSIDVQRLALTLDQKRELARRLEVNALPANRDYRYDYFTDNCSTRVRDAIDGVLGGQLHALARRPGRESLRENALRMTADEPWLYVALLIVLGPSTDRPIDEWDEDFLPEKLQQTMRELRVRDASGQLVPLVEAERVAFSAARPPIRRRAPRWGIWFLVVGVFAGGMLWILAGRPGAPRATRVAFGGMVASWGGLLGAIGCFLLGSWMFTPHVAVYRNQNLLLMAPFAIVLGGLGLGVAWGRPKAARATYVVAGAAAALSGLAVVVKLLPASIIAPQENLSLILACVPLWSGMALGARRLAATGPVLPKVKGRARSST